MQRAIKISLGLLVLLFSTRCFGQETVFDLLKSDEKRADEFFDVGNFKEASLSYTVALQRQKASKDVFRKLAHTHFRLKNYEAAIVNFDNHRQRNNSYSKADVLLLGESYTSLGNYEKAVEVFQSYVKEHGDDPLIMKKIWRLTNVQFLFEDSMHYAVAPLQFNSGAAEISPVRFGDGVMFVSNRRQLRVVEKLNAANEPFFDLYYARIFKDSIANGKKVAAKISKPQIALQSKFNIGPFSLFDNDIKMVYSTNQTNGSRTLGLFFAVLKDGVWVNTSEFKYNSPAYSISEPTISPTGDVLYFSSDMRGGIGGKDLYRSRLVNGEWTKPENLGDAINTLLDESYPFVSDQTLYFSSVGHAGLGGLDIFKSQIFDNGFDEPVNIGYPINSTVDDFSISINSSQTGGYFCSNRIGKGLNDDMFEFEMDLQTYPVEISGFVRYKEHLVDDTTQVENLTNAKLILIDAVRNVQVFESSSDANGKFSLTIPYFSKYKIKVIGFNNHENLVSLEIPKHRKDYGNYDIVVVKDAFKPHQAN